MTIDEIRRAIETALPDTPFVIAVDSGDDFVTGFECNEANAMAMLICLVNDFTEQSGRDPHEIIDAIQGWFEIQRGD